MPGGCWKFKGADVGVGADTETGVGGPESGGAVSEHRGDGKGEQRHLSLTLLAAFPEQRAPQRGAI